MNNQGYLSRAWHDLTQDPKWWQPVLILSLVNLIPIVGGLIVAGYMVDWAREGAWGMRRALPRKVGDAGKRLKWGFFAYIITLCWVLPISIVGSLFSIVPLIGWVIAIAANVCTLIAGVIATAASIRMSIYDRFGAGMQISRMLGMAKRDAGGLARCFFISLLEVVPVVIGAVIVAIAFAPLLMGVSLSTADVYSPAATMGIAGAIAGGGAFATIITLLIVFVVMVAVTTCQALTYRAYGYWVGQFQPAKWNGMNDPMPFEPGYVERTTHHTTDTVEESESEGQSGFAQAKERVAAAASAASAAAGTVAGKAAEAANGFKVEHTDADTVPADSSKPDCIDAEVIAVEDANASGADKSAAQTEGERLAAIYRESYEKHQGKGSGAEKDAADTCPDCGKPIEASYKFCTNCGAKLR